MNEDILISYTAPVVTVSYAPFHASMSLEAVHHLKSHVMSVSGDEVTFGDPNTGIGQVTYQVTGWDSIRKVLTLRRKSTLREKP